MRRLPILFFCLGLVILLLFFSRRLLSTVNNPLRVPTQTIMQSETPSLALTLSSQPTGKIVYICQVNGDQICIINADGSGMRQLTTDSVRHWYPSLAPDGDSVVYSAFRTDNTYEIYEIDHSGTLIQLTNGLGILKAPEISPDGKQIIIGNGNGMGNESIWLMDRDGSNPRQLFGPGWDPSWSPNGQQILFASYDDDRNIQLFVINRNGSGLRQVTQMEGLRGRNDWSPNGSMIATYAGQEWTREVFVMDPYGANLQQVTAGGNNLAPSFSPDGQWITFTSYRDNYNNKLGCEIYIMRISDSYTLRLTDNDYCDWQPRWGP